MLKIINNIKNIINKLSKMADNALSQATKRAGGELESNIPKKKVNKQTGSLGKSEGCRRKIALLAAYNGKDYYGVQFNPGMKTIESDIFAALVKIGAITQDQADTPGKMWFQRGSRTDKNVSAAGQIFSMKAVLVPDFITKLNEELPQQIRAFGYVRTTNSFDSKNWCESRTYMYMSPTLAFAPLEKFITDDYRVTPDILERVREILQKFVGTHKFHNFTSGTKYEEACAKRYIMKFECSEPYEREGLEFVTIRVKGQSFMLHQIRKMIGLTIAILRGYCPESTIESSWGPEKVDIPKAPGLGLVLEELHFAGYNKKFGCDGIHEAIDWLKYKEEMERFKEEHIISSIVAQEKKDRIMFNWLRTLQYHNFDQERLYGPKNPWYKMINQLDGKSPKNAKEVETLVDGQMNEASTTSEVHQREANTTAVQLREANTILVSDVQANEACTISNAQPVEAGLLSKVQPIQGATVSSDCPQSGQVVTSQTFEGIEQILNGDKTLDISSTDVSKVPSVSVDDDSQLFDDTEKTRQSIAKSS